MSLCCAPWGCKNKPLDKTQHNATQHNKVKYTALSINNTWRNATGHYAGCRYFYFYCYAEYHLSLCVVLLRSEEGKQFYFKQK
jgi:hypothetical protein